MSAAAKRLGTVLAGGIQGAAEARWMCLGTVLSVSPLRVLVDDTEASAAYVKVGPSLQVGETVLLGCLRGRPSVSFVVIGKVVPPEAGPVFTLRGDSIRVANLSTVSALPSFGSNEGEVLLWSEEATPAASVELGGNGHFYLKLAEDSGGANRLKYDTEPSWVVTPRVLPLADGSLHTWVVGTFPDAADDFARVSLNVGDPTPGAWVEWLFRDYEWRASISASYTGEGGGGAVFNSAPPIFGGTVAVLELGLAADGELTVWVNNEVATPDAVEYGMAGMVPLTDTELHAMASLWQDAQEFRLYEAVVDATPMTEDQRSARTAALMATYL